MTDHLQMISIDCIEPNPDQPRKIFDADALNELANSIRAEGLMQPITVRPMGEHYQIVAGERRWRAHHLLSERGLSAFDAIACRVKEMDDLERDISAIIENLIRVDITPLEEAYAFGRLIDNGLPLDQIAAKTGTSPARIELRLRLLKLDPVLAKFLKTGQLDPASAAEIARLPKPQDQLRIFRMLNRGEISAAAGSRGESLRHAISITLGEAEEGMLYMFGDGAPPVSPEEQRVLTRMECKIGRVVAMIAEGWKDNECVIANRVNPDRAKTVADKISLIRKALRTMERELRNVSAQAVIIDAHSASGSRGLHSSSRE